MAQRHLGWSRDAHERPRSTAGQSKLDEKEGWWSQKVQKLHLRRRTLGVARTAPKKPKTRILDTHNQHALTGWVKCGWCGGPKSLANLSRYVCSTFRYAKKCKNSRGIKEPILMEQTFQALRRRIMKGPDFREKFIQAFAREQQAGKKRQADALEIEERIDRLMIAVERGVDAERVTKRIVSLQQRLEELQEKIRTDAPPKLPDEMSIRAALLRTIGAIEVSGDIERQRILFKCVLSEVVLTPISGQRTGETIEISLREKGWPEVWRIATGEQ